MSLTFSIRKTTEHGISVRKTPVIGNISLRILQNYPDLKIVGLDFYITTEESKRFTDFPKDFKGIAGWILEVKSNTPGNTTQVLRRNNFPSAHQFLVRNFGTGGVGKWSLFEGKVVE